MGEAAAGNAANTAGYIKFVRVKFNGHRKSPATEEETVCKWPPFKLFSTTNLIGRSEKATLCLRA